MNDDFVIPERLVDDIIAVEKLKGRDFDHAELHGNTVVFSKGGTVVHRHRIVTPGSYK